MTDATDDKVNRLIHTYSLVCAGIATQPIPFADIFILTPIQIHMAYKINSLRGNRIDKEEILKVFKKIGQTVGLGQIAQQTIIGLYKIGLPFLGGYMTIPLVYGATYSIGKILDYLIVQEKTDKDLNVKEVKELFKKFLKEGKEKIKSYIKQDKAVYKRKLKKKYGFSIEDFKQKTEKEKDNLIDKIARKLNQDLNQDRAKPFL